MLDIFYNVFYHPLLYVLLIIYIVCISTIERAGQQNYSKDLLTEGNNINKSLSQLMLCIQFLVKQSKVNSYIHTPRGSVCFKQTI